MNFHADSSSDFDARLLDYDDFYNTATRIEVECEKRAAEEFALLNIVINSPQMTVTESNIRVNFSDQLGIIGREKGICVIIKELDLEFKPFGS